MSLKINNEKEFNELFNLHYKELCRVLLPIIKDTDAIEDVVQDVFVKLWIRRNELEVKTSFKAYLYKAVILRAFDYLRKEKTANLAKTELKIVQSQSHNPIEELLHEKELINAIEKGMDEMSESMKAIFHLSRFSGLKNREIAEQLNISIKTVESNMGKALKLMHLRLSPFIKQGSKLLVYWFLFINFIDIG